MLCTQKGKNLEEQGFSLSLPFSAVFMCVLSKNYLLQFRVKKLFRVKYMTKQDSFILHVYPFVFSVRSNPHLSHLVSKHQEGKVLHQDCPTIGLHYGPSFIYKLTTSSQVFGFSPQPFSKHNIQNTLDICGEVRDIMEEDKNNGLV